jgi:pyruvate carboxylase subunit B
MKYFVDVGGRTIEVEVDGEQVIVDGTFYIATLSPVAGTPLRQLVVDGRPLVLAVNVGGQGRWGLELHGERHDAEVVDERTRHIRSLASASGRPQAAAVLRAPMPGLVVRVQVDSGQQVAPGAGLVVLEAMKMENELRASATATVRTILVEPGQAVEKGQVLIEFE